MTNQERHWGWKGKACILIPLKALSPAFEARSPRFSSCKGPYKLQSWLCSRPDMSRSMVPKATAISVQCRGQCQERTLCKSWAFKGRAFEATGCACDTHKASLTCPCIVVRLRVGSFREKVPPSTRCYLYSLSHPCSLPTWVSLWCDHRDGRKLGLEGCSEGKERRYFSFK